MQIDEFSQTFWYYVLIWYESAFHNGCGHAFERKCPRLVAKNYFCYPSCGSPERCLPSHIHTIQVSARIYQMTDDSVKGKEVADRLRNKKNMDQSNKSIMRVGQLHSDGIPV